MFDNDKEDHIEMEDLDKFKLINNESNSNNKDQKTTNIDLLNYKEQILTKYELYKDYLKSFFIFILVVFISFYSDNKELEKSFIGNSTEVFFNGYRTYLTYESIKKFNSYIDICHKNILLDKNKLSLIPNPKITVTMPIYNGGKYLYYSLRSIQNQKMKEIEIILIDDCSTDDSLKIIEKYMEEDPRIRLIKNEKNRRILYSKSIAALNANGKYITQIDQDDMFIRDDVFDLLYNEAEKNDLDLIQIRDFILNEFHFTRRIRVNKPENHLIFPHVTKYETQPELKNKLFGKDYNFILWGLLIKADLYKKSVYHMWPIIANYKLIFHEDFTITFMIVILARNFKFLNIFCYVHLSHKNAASADHWSNNNYFLGVLFFTRNLYEYYIKDNPKDIEILIDSLFQVSVIKKSHKLFPNLFKFIIRKILENDFLTYEQKEKFRKKYDIVNDDFKIWNTYEYFMDSKQYNSILLYQNSLFNKRKKDKNVSYLNPKYSLIIYCTEYNFLQNTITSIENQIYDNYEIILIYDNNDNNELDKIKNLVGEYINIKFINNIEKKGIFYSYSSGVLESKGDYILIINSGFTLATENILKDINNYIENDNKINILEFNLLNNKYDDIRNNSLSLYKCEHYKSEINLESIKFNKQNRQIDQEKELIINKLIKADLYKDLIKEFKLNKDNNRIYNYFDDILYFLIHKKGIEIKIINDFGIIQYISKTKSFELNKIMNDKSQIIHDSLFYINFLFDNSDNTFEKKKLVLNQYFTIFSVIYNKFNVISDEAKKLYNKFLNCDFISQYDKNNLKIYYKSLIN